MASIFFRFKYCFFVVAFFEKIRRKSKFQEGKNLTHSTGKIIAIILLLLLILIFIIIIVIIIIVIIIIIFIHGHSINHVFFVSYVADIRSLGSSSGRAVSPFPLIILMSMASSIITGIDQVLNSQNKMTSPTCKTCELNCS